MLKYVSIYIKREVCFYIYIKREVCLYICIKRERQHNETHQTLLGKWERRDGGKEIQGGENIFKVYRTHLWNYQCILIKSKIKNKNIAICIGI
jgi:hypothetical protein